MGRHPSMVVPDVETATLAEEEPPMDAMRFDAIAQTLARSTRRTVLRALTGGVTGLMALSGTRPAQARKQKKRCRKASRPTRCGKGKNSVCTNLDIDNEHCGNCQTACTAPETCQNGTCGLGQTCDDGIKNGNETDVDCGGSCGATCANDRSCQGNGDCASGHCCDGACRECCDDPDCPNDTVCIDRVCQPGSVCRAGQAYCQDNTHVHCGPFCVCATSVDTGRTVCGDNSVRLCNCTTDDECTAQLAGVGFPNTLGICARDIDCSCPNSNVCIAASCGGAT